MARSHPGSRFGFSVLACILGLLTLWGLLVAQAAQSNVLTEPVSWQVRVVNDGLLRLKEQFLDRSILNDTEFVGAVLRTPAGQFTFTQGQGRPGQDQVTFRIFKPESAELVGLWHTHGDQGPARAVFSPTDAELVRRTGLPFYLITPDGEIRVLRPEHVADGSVKRARPLSQRGRSLARLPRGSHPGERLMGRPVRGCADVMEV